ncbi:FabD/lysophospholipase-like protein [Mycena sp. CBHHK59/15]|nr:FabD/lysophospholipase-like protein [Mycena sp. CBHHK59/15]
MSDSNSAGLRLLSLDGGGIRGLSMLLILQSIMYRIKAEEGLDEVPRPCDYFDLIGGTSTGGLIALMLGRLRMTVEDAISAYGRLSGDIFSEVKPVGSNGKFKATKLENGFKQVVREYSVSNDSEEEMRDTSDEICRIFVCAMNAANLNAALPVLFRTYDTSTEPADKCAIWEAARATTAAPTVFKAIKIGAPGMEEVFIDGGVGRNNPTAQVLEEAELIFPTRLLACVISIGTGHPKTIQIPTPSRIQRLIPLEVARAMISMTTDCEKTHQEMARRFRDTPDVYFRFNVEQGLQGVKLNQWDRLGEVLTHTRKYMLLEPVNQQLAKSVQVLLDKIGKVATRALNGPF